MLDSVRRGIESGTEATDWLAVNPLDNTPSLPFDFLKVGRGGIGSSGFRCRKEVISSFTDFAFDCLSNSISFLSKTMVEARNDRQILVVLLDFIFHRRFQCNIKLLLRILSKQDRQFYWNQAVVVV
jgi:hypothetical protein